MIRSDGQEGIKGAAQPPSDRPVCEIKEMLIDHTENTAGVSYVTPIKSDCIFVPLLNVFHSAGPLKNIILMFMMIYWIIYYHFY